MGIRARAGDLRDVVELDTILTQMISSRLGPAPKVCDEDCRRVRDQAAASLLEDPSFIQQFLQVACVRLGIQRVLAALELWDSLAQAGELDLPPPRRALSMIRSPAFQASARGRGAEFA